MSRSVVRAIVVVAGLVAGAAPAAAQADPLDLARGLRENGMPDLALEYLGDLEGKKLLPETAAAIGLERARAKLELANTESDDGKRGALVADAKADFDKFLATAKDHPRRPEAAMSLARLISVQAKGELTRANNIDEKEQRKAELVKVRPLFEDAAKRFGEAAAAYAKNLDDPNLTPAARKDLTADVYKAELDRAINSLEMSRTFISGGGVQEVEARGKAIDLAKSLFDDLGRRDQYNPLCWVAKAWSAECEQEKDKPVDAKNAFDLIRTTAQKLPAAAQGARLARFFEIRADYTKAFGENTPAAFRRVQPQLEQWLAEPAARLARPAPEVYAAKYYLAKVKYQQARYLLKEDPKTKDMIFTGDARGYLQAAERDFRKVIEPANDYSSRAAEDHTRVIRILVGKAEKPPAAYTTFDDCLMAAQVQMYRAVKEAQDPKERAERMSKSVALYDRLFQLPVPKEAAGELTNAHVAAVYAYLMADRPYQAAVLGEHLARTSKAAGPGARAGVYALQAYLATANKLDPERTEAKKADLDRAVKIGLFLDKQFPTDANTDAARITIAQQLLRDRNAKGAFDLAARVSPSGAKALNGRLIEAAAAFELIRPQPPGVEPQEGAVVLTPAQKSQIYQKVVADLSGVADLPPTASAEDARLSTLVHLQLAEIHLTNKPDGYALGEQVAAAAAARVGTFTSLSPDDKLELQSRAEFARLRAVYGEVFELYKQKKYPAVMAKLDPILAEIAKNGPAFIPPMGEGADAKPGQPENVAAATKRLDDFRRDAVIVLALQTRIKEGAVDKAAELFDLLKRLGGSLDASVDALAQLIAAVRPQIDALEKQGNGEEAKKLIDGVGALLDKVAKDPKITTRVLVFLGRGLKDIRNYDKAIEVLQQVQAPPAVELKKNARDVAAEFRVPVLLYRGARLELARTYRLAKKFDEADKILKDAIGTKDRLTPMGTEGWAFNAPDFKKEAAFLLEARGAAATDQKEMLKYWGEARGKWTEMAGQYLGPLQKLQAGKKDPKAAFTALLAQNALPPSELLPAKPADIRAALAANPPPMWLTQLLGNQAYVDNLKNTVTRVEANLKPVYHDLYFESIRCLVKANTQLLAKNPDKLATTIGGLAKQMVQLEKVNPDLSGDVKARFAELMDEYPALKKAYQDQGGTAMLKPSEATAAK